MSTPIKHFVATRDCKHVNRNPGRYMLRIYEHRTTKYINEIEPNPWLEYIGEVEFFQGMTRGMDSEVMNWLSSNGHIPVECTGYYHDHTKKGFVIQILPTF